MNHIEAAPPAPRTALPHLLRQFTWITLALTLCTVAGCTAQLLVFHRHYPQAWPFFSPSIRFGDFTIYQHKFQFFHRTAFFTTDWPFTYPAPMAVLYEAFFRGFGAHALRAFVTFSMLAFAVPAALFARALVERGIAPRIAAAFAAMLLFLSWPALLMLDRANVEV
ncbi:MAG TPA: hypothetical protein VGU23_03655, partial [Acidobacteriaceae bacterium]|nr:hypothetical protein [Acidobacteriaceae bacterium]